MLPRRGNQSLVTHEPRPRWPRQIARAPASLRSVFLGIVFAPHFRDPFGNPSSLALFFETDCFSHSGGFWIEESVFNRKWLAQTVTPLKV